MLTVSRFVLCYLVVVASFVWVSSEDAVPKDRDIDVGDVVYLQESLYRTDSESESLLLRAYAVDDRDEIRRLSFSQKVIAATANHKGKVTGKTATHLFCQLIEPPNKGKTVFSPVEMASLHGNYSSSEP